MIACFAVYMKTDFQEIIQDAVSRRIDSGSYTVTDLSRKTEHAHKGHQHPQRSSGECRIDPRFLSGYIS